MLRLVVLVALAGMLTSGCGAAYMANRDRLVQSAVPEDYGPPPPENYREVQREIIERDLLDPDAVLYRQEREPAHGVIPAEPLGDKPALVWITSVEVNAKNRMGGYVGYRLCQFAWRGGALFAWREGAGEDREWTGLSKWTYASGR